MSSKEVLVWNIKSINPEADKSTILFSEFQPQLYPSVSVNVEQNIHCALAEITQSIIWSQGHLIESEDLAVCQSRDLNHSAEYFPDYPLLDAVKAIDCAMNTSIAKNSYLRDAVLGFQKGSETAIKVLDIEELKTSKILKRTRLSQSTLANIDEQVITLSGYYSAWEALRANRKAASEFDKNPFFGILTLFKDGARNINLKTVTPTTPIKANVFTKKGNSIRMVKWIQDKHPIPTDLFTNG